MTSPGIQQICEPSVVQDSFGMERLALSKIGWSQWTWNGHKVNFVQAGDEGSPIVLVHGFGASSYHWRYNIPELSKTNRVFAVDLLGFGFSAKPLVDYGSENLWAGQVTDFVREVVGEDAKVVLVGNSLGGHVSIAVAARNPDLVKGVVCLNIPVNTGSAGTDSFEEEDSRSLRWWSPVARSLQDAFRRLTILFAFYSLKLRVKQVLESVYFSKANVDKELVESILLASNDSKAAEVYCRLVGSRQSRASASTSALLKTMEMPLLLLWGDRDPWLRPGSAEKILDVYENAQKVGLNAGHCPHDELPSEVNHEIRKWMHKLTL